MLLLIRAPSSLLQTDASTILLASESVQLISGKTVAVSRCSCILDLSEMEYELEDINVFGKALNLQQSICNSGCHEFVLVRKFSGFWSSPFPDFSVELS